MKKTQIPPFQLITSTTGKTMYSESKTITKNVPLTIRVYARSPHRCHPDCPYCEKDVVSSGNYDCTMYLKCIDKGRDDADGYSHYGFVRCEECIARFGMPEK